MDSSYQESIAVNTPRPKFVPPDNEREFWIEDKETVKNGSIRIVFCKSCNQYRKKQYFEYRGFGSYYKWVCLTCGYHIKGDL